MSRRNALAFCAFESAQPKNPRYDWIATGRVDATISPVRRRSLKTVPAGMPSPIFLRDLQFAQWRTIVLPGQSPSPNLEVETG